MQDIWGQSNYSFIFYSDPQILEYVPGKGAL